MTEIFIDEKYETLTERQSLRDQLIHFRKLMDHQNLPVNVKKISISHNSDHLEKLNFIK